MNKKILLYILPLIFLACKKQQPEDTPDPLVAEQTKALASTRTTNSNGHSILTTYNYNSGGKLYREISKDETTGAKMTQDYLYKNGTLTRSVIANEQRQLSTIKYTYENDRLVSMQYFEHDNYQNQEFLFERYFEYKDNQIHKVSTRNSDGEVSEYTLFTFSAGNVTETRSFSASGTLIYSGKYEYDQKINPYFGQYDKLQAAIGNSKCNVTKSVHTDHLANTAVTSNFEYQYRSSGQPVSVYAAIDKNKPLIFFYY